MAIREEFERSGNKLFRLRSYLPPLVAGLYIFVFRNFEYPSQSHRLDVMWEILCLAVSFFGFGIRCVTVGFVPEGTSGRNTKRQKAASLNTTGTYSVVRHPLYLGNFFIWLGISLFPRMWWFVCISVLLFWLCYERIIFAEEEFLRKKFGGEFLNWANETPAFAPRIKKWKPAQSPFSIRTVLKREYHGFFAIIASFTVLEILGDFFARGKLIVDTMWLIILAVGFLVYISIRFIDKKTDLLKYQRRKNP